MAKWEKIGRTVSAEGTTVIYRLQGTPMTVESRLRHIPHAAGKVGYMGKRHGITRPILSWITERRSRSCIGCRMPKNTPKLFIAEVLA